VHPTNADADHDTDEDSDGGEDSYRDYHP